MDTHRCPGSRYARACLSFPPTTLFYIIVALFPSRVEKLSPSRFSSPLLSYSSPFLRDSSLVDIPRESWPNYPPPRPPSFPEKRRYVEQTSRYKVAARVNAITRSLGFPSDGFGGEGEGKNLFPRVFFFFFEGRERSFGIRRRRIERERESTRFKSGNSGYIRLFARDFSVDTGLVALDSEASTDYARNCIQILFLIPSTRPPFLSITFNRAPTIAL